jgi:hypothetical protein
MENRRRQNLERHLDVLSHHPHKPVLLMDGGLESQANRDYLKWFFDRMVEPKAYVTVPGSNHYSNTISKFGLALYDREVIKRTVQEVETFFRSAGGDSNRIPAEAAARNGA